MRFDNQHYTEVEILSFQARCKISEMSYEQTVVVVTKHGDTIRLLDFMGFAVTEERLGKGKKLILCIPYVDGAIEVLESGTPQLVKNDFSSENDNPSRPTVIARIIEVNPGDHDLLLDVGFGQLYLIPPDGQLARLPAGSIVKFTAKRVDLLEIL